MKPGLIDIPSNFGGCTFLSQPESGARARQSLKKQPVVRHAQELRKGHIHFRNAEALFVVQPETFIAQAATVAPVSCSDTAVARRLAMHTSSICASIGNGCQPDLSRRRSASSMSMARTEPLVRNARRSEDQCWLQHETLHDQGINT